MTTLISNQSQWQQILRRQKLANAQRWLLTLEQSPNPTELALHEYDNLFKAFEFTLLYPDTIDLAYRYILVLNPIVFGFADWDRWLKYLEQALALSQKASRSEVEVHIKELYADFLVHMGFPKRAIRYYEEVKTVYQTNDELDRFARILTKLATEYGRLGDMNIAQNYMDKAVAIANQLNDQELLAHVCLDLSAFEMRNQNWKAGLEASEKAYKLYEAVQDSRFMLRALTNKSACLAHLGDWEEVEQLSTHLVEQMSDAKHQLNFIKLKINLGFAAYSQNDIRMAELHWQEALQLAEQINVPMQKGVLYCNLGAVYNHFEEWEVAEKMHHKALITLAKLGDIENWANAVENLAELYKAQNRNSELRQLLTRAIVKLKPSESIMGIKKFVDLFETWLAELP